MVKWINFRQIAELGLKELPGAERSIRRIAKREGWESREAEYPRNPAGTWRKRKACGGGSEFRASFILSRASGRPPMRKQADSTNEPTRFLMIVSGRVLVEGAT
jgi:hypothetical protein